MSTKEPSSIRLAGALGIAGLASGIVLVSIYLWAKPLIEENRATALKQAVLRVVPGSDRVVPYVLSGDSIEAADTGGKLPEGDAVFAGVTDSGEIVGFAVPAEGTGFMDTIKLLYGYDPARKVVVGMEVLESRETPGLGDKIEKDERYLSNFDALAVEPEIVAVKPGEKTAPNQVDTISGATISSKAVVKIIRESTERWVPLLNAQDEQVEQLGEERAHE